MLFQSSADTAGPRRESAAAVDRDRAGDRAAAAESAAGVGRHGPASNGPAVRVVRPQRARGHGRGARVRVVVAENGNAATLLVILSLPSIGRSQEADAADPEATLKVTFP